MSHISVAAQLYTIRSLQDSTYDTFERLMFNLAEIGYQGIEALGTHGFEASEMGRALDKTRLQICSNHVALSELETDLDRHIAFNQKIGNHVLVLPYLAEHQRPTTRPGWTQLAKKIDSIASRCSEAGMMLLYHNHDFEMQELEGKLLLDRLLEVPHLGLELDLAWVVRGGRDPLSLLERYAGRCSRVHIKDLAPKGTNPGEQGWADVGFGTLDWPTLVPAAIEAGAEWLIVEHDHPAHPMATVERSFTYLKRLLSQM
ncbi:MAG: sugar phosphate isomerase/epimerase [Trueperaceae bacterium]|nr:MAG: sugar phosphate isomerase/epimerase [Trueperaceae bacterium]